MQSSPYTETVLMELYRDLRAIGAEEAAAGCQALFEEYADCASDEAGEARSALMAGGELSARLECVYGICGGGGRLFDLCCACLVHPELSAVLDGAFSGCSLETCVALSESEPSYDELSASYENVKLLLIAEGGASPFFRRRFSADARLLGFLEGSSAPDRALEGCTRLLLPEDEPQRLFTDGDDIPYIKDALAKPGTILQLAAEQGRGRRLLLAHACRELGLSCLTVDAGRLLAMKEERRADMIRRIRREALLQGHVLCFFGLDEKLWPLEDFLRECVSPMARLARPVCVCTGAHTELIAAASIPVSRIALPDMSRGAHIAVWEGYSAQFSLTGVDCFSIGSKYKLSPLQIRKAAERLSERQRRGIQPDDQAVSEVCAEVLPPAEGNIKRVRVSYTIDDLVLPPEQLQVLYNICAHVEYKRRVYDDWDMESRFSYGRNVSAIFVGAPGTGKTMAVHVLSNMLHLPLYHVDLSQVVDKYVGETEKRLEEIFNIAERSNTILFFDEADGIFGKRSDVKDSKDKYANTQSSYILQRIEQFEGVVILATNFNKNIDEAFMRRIRYLVEFQKPGEELRLRLWKGAFSEKTPLKDVDFPYLARSFELTGGSIKNIALNAAFLAAQEGGHITMKHILVSLRDENKKLGKTMLKKDFAEYGMLF